MMLGRWFYLRMITFSHLKSMTFYVFDKIEVRLWFNLLKGVLVNPLLETPPLQFSFLLECSIVDIDRLSLRNIRGCRDCIFI